MSDPVNLASSLSVADNCVLTLAQRVNADTVLSDDRLLRRVAEVEGIRAIGTLGVLARAVRAGRLPAVDAEAILDELVERHGFRISADVYRAATKSFRCRPWAAPPTLPITYSPAANGVTLISR